jgi:hypothetical protein
LNIIMQRAAGKQACLETPLPAGLRRTNDGQHAPLVCRQYAASHLHHLKTQLLSWCQDQHLVQETTRAGDSSDNKHLMLAAHKSLLQMLQA